MAAGEEFFLLSHHGRGGKEDFVWGSGGDRPGDRPRVKGLDGGFVGVWGDDAAHGVGGDIGEELGLEGGFLGTGAGRDVTMGWETWEGKRARVRNWEQRRERWLWTGRV